MKKLRLIVKCNVSKKENPKEIASSQKSEEECSEYFYSTSKHSESVGSWPSGERQLSDDCSYPKLTSSGIKGTDNNQPLRPPTRNHQDSVDEEPKEGTAKDNPATKKDKAEERKAKNNASENRKDDSSKDKKEETAPMENQKPQIPNPAAAQTTTTPPVEAPAQPRRAEPKMSIEAAGSKETPKESKKDRESNKLYPRKVASDPTKDEAPKISAEGIVAPSRANAVTNQRSKPEACTAIVLSKKKPDSVEPVKLAATKIEAGPDSQIINAFTSVSGRETLVLLNCPKGRVVGSNMTTSKQELGIVSKNYGANVDFTFPHTDGKIFPYDRTAFFDTSSKPTAPTRCAVFSAMKILGPSSFRISLRMHKLDERLSKDLFDSKIPVLDSDVTKLSQRHFFDYRILDLPSLSSSSRGFPQKILHGLFLVTETKIVRFMLMIDSSFPAALKQSCCLIEVCESTEEIVTYGFDQNHQDSLTQKDPTKPSVLGHQTLMFALFRRRTSQESSSYFLKVFCLTATVVNKPISEFEFSTKTLALIPLGGSIPQYPVEVVFNSANYSIIVLGHAPVGQDKPEGDKLIYKVTAVTIGISAELAKLIAIKTNTEATISSTPQLPVPSPVTSTVLLYPTYETPQELTFDFPILFKTGGTRLLCETVKTENSAKQVILVTLRDGPNEIYELEFKNKDGKLQIRNRVLDGGQSGNRTYNFSVATSGSEQLALLVRSKHMLEVFRLKEKRRTTPAALMEG